MCNKCDLPFEFEEEYTYGDEVYDLPHWVVWGLILLGSLLLCLLVVKN